MLSEFKAFIARGNVLDLAVAVIIGAAFATITKSLTDDLIMPVVGAIFGGLDFANYFVLLGPDPGDVQGRPGQLCGAQGSGRRGARLGPVRHGADQLPDPGLRHLPPRPQRQQDDEARRGSCRAERGRAAGRDPRRAEAEAPEQPRTSIFAGILSRCGVDVPLDLAPRRMGGGPSSLLLVKISPSVTIVKRPTARDTGPSLPLSGRPIILARAPNGPDPPVAPGR